MYSKSAINQCSSEHYHENVLEQFAEDCEKPGIRISAGEHFVALSALREDLLTGEVQLFQGLTHE